MGNSPSGCPVSGILPPEKLKWKTGPRDASTLPYPHARNKTFEELAADEDFRYFVYKNLDRNYLLDAILAEVDLDEVLSADIEFLRKLDEGTTHELKREIDIFEKVLATDVTFTMSDVMRWNEQYLRLHTHIELSPFSKAFHKRIAVLRGFAASIHAAKSSAKAPKDLRRHNVNALNSNSHPQILPLFALKTTGLAFLKLFPILMASSDVSAHHDLLVAPVISLCDDINRLNTLSLYPSWAPKPARPSKNFVLLPKHLSSTTGDVSKVVDALPNSCWICSESRGTIQVTLDSPLPVKSICINWASSGAASGPSNCGAAESLVIYGRRGKSDAVVRLKTYDVVDQKNTQTVWKHEYAIEEDCLSYIELHVKGFAANNHSNSIKIYELEVACFDDDAQALEPLGVCMELQSRLFELSNFGILHSAAFSCLISIVRATGSLGLLMKLLLFLEERAANEDLKLMSSPQVSSLLEAMDNTLEAATKERESSLMNSSKIRFDTDARSDGTELLDGNMVCKCSAANSASPAYAQLSCIMQSGIWEWEMTMFSDEAGIADVCAIGVGLKPLSSITDGSHEMWLVKCWSGSSSFAFSDGYRRVEIIASDVCRFVFDASAGTLQLTVNGVDHGVIFTDIPPCVSPLVVFYDSFDCKLLNAKFSDIEATTAAVIEGTSDFCAATAAMSESVVPSFNETILSRVAAIAAVRLEMSERRECRQLEYPFAVQVCKDVIEDTFKLLATYLTAPVVHHSVLNILKILEAQFSHLGEINPVDLGFSTFMENASDLQSPVDILNDLMEDDNKDIQTFAAKVYARGSSIFLPSLIDRIRLVSQLLSSLINGTKEEHKYHLLNILLSQLSSYQSCLNIISLYAKGYKNDEIVKSVHIFGSNLISFLHVPDLNGDQTAPVVFQLLVRLFEMLVIDVVNETKTISGPGKLFQYLLQQVFLKCSERLPANRESLLYSLTHPLLHALTMCCGNVSLVHAIHPFTTALLINSSKALATPECSDSWLLYNKFLPVSKFFPQFEGGNKGWLQINAFFEPDGSFTLEEGGCMYESVTSSNTCAITNITFSSPQRAAWEFELVGDSSGDECSVFGAAQIPLSSRCYSSSPDLWMRRSYNGYMYNRGRTLDSGNMEKIHPVCSM